MWKGSKRLHNRLYSGIPYQAMAAIVDVVSKRSLQLSSLRWVKVTNRVMQTFDLVYSDPGDHALVSRFIKAEDVNGGILIVFIALENIYLVILLRGWTKGGLLMGFSSVTCVISLLCCSYTPV